MPRHFSWFPLKNRPVRFVCLALTVSLALLTLRTANADLFYKVEKAIKLTDSGLNPAADGSIPFSVTGLNNAGSFTGFFPSATANKLHAFLWNNTSHTFLDLNNLLAADSSMATCFNDAGTVAGVFWELGTYTEKGFLYYADGTVLTFAPPTSAVHPSIAAVTAINASGNLIGTYNFGVNGTRGFLLRQGTNNALTFTNLGTLGANPAYTYYIWPEALNDANQVVGDVFLLPGNAAMPSYTKAFFWDGGPMSLIDASTLGTDYKAISINDLGLAVGLYGTGDLHDPAAVAGSFWWDGSDVADLGNLGGVGGAIAFTLTNSFGAPGSGGSGTAFGTSADAGGALHLFGWSGRGGLQDLGSASVYEGDTSFRPFSISAVEVSGMEPIGLGAAPAYDLAGFGQDADGHTRSLLWKDGSIYNVIDLMPAYLSFAAISNAYGSKVLVNSTEQIACAGTDAAGHQMALLPFGRSRHGQ